jgi:uncharacterized iron-regulated membrane protein
VIRSLHRQFGLFVAVFWLVQALTGVLLTFRHELDNASLSPSMGADPASADTAALGERIEAIQRGNGKVSSLWVASFGVNRFDVYYADASGTDRIMRVDGAGRVLRDAPESERLANGGFYRTLTDIHTTLLSGDVGRWIIAISGIALLTNIVFGLKLAWPRARAWRQVLIPQPVRNPTARLYGLHRAIGLWIGVPMLILVLAGVALRFDDDVEQALGVVRPEPTGAPTGKVGISPARALDMALARYPGSTVTALSLPEEQKPWYRVRLNARGEVHRLYGTTTLFLSAVNGAVLLEYPASAAPFARWAYDLLYPLHTGEVGALPGRLLVVALGLLLMTSGIFGILLWFKRRKPK